jgi:hypothetical protein
MKTNGHYRRTSSCFGSNLMDVIINLDRIGLAISHSIFASAAELLALTLEHERKAWRPPGALAIDSLLQHTSCKRIIFKANG